MFELLEFTTACKRVVANGPKAILELMQDTLQDLESVKKATAELSAASPIALLHEAEDLLIANIALEALTDSPAHNHTMWAVIGIYQGREDNVFFERRNDTLSEKNRRAVHAGEAIVLGPEVIHAVSNPLSTPTLGIHVYGGNLRTAQRSMWHPKTLQECPYDAATFFGWSREMSEAFRVARSA